MENIYRNLILDFLIHASDKDKEKLAERIIAAASQLRGVRTGCDFECECWQTAWDLLTAAGIENAEDF